MHFLKEFDGLLSHVRNFFQWESAGLRPYLPLCPYLPALTLMAYFEKGKIIVKREKKPCNQSLNVVE